ncbi:MAG TPA: hypothetical protein VK075_01255 [Pseudogracilibacillus sp.]|nr:hypothetical protein [Pseudogracilibacillus sp.]
MNRETVLKLMNELANETPEGATKQGRKRYFKIGGAIANETINQLNYYAIIRKWCKNITSDSAIKSWQSIADHVYTAVYEQRRVKAYNVVYG